LEKAPDDRPSMREVSEALLAFSGPTAMLPVTLVIPQASGEGQSRRTPMTPEPRSGSGARRPPSHRPSNPRLRDELDQAQIETMSLTRRRRTLALVAGAVAAVVLGLVWVLASSREKPPPSTHPPAPAAPAPPSPKDPVPPPPPLPKISEPSAIEEPPAAAEPS